MAAPDREENDRTPDGIDWPGRDGRGWRVRLQQMAGISAPQAGGSGVQTAAR